MFISCDSSKCNHIQRLYTSEDQMLRTNMGHGYHQGLLIGFPLALCLLHLEIES